MAEAAARDGSFLTRFVYAAIFFVRDMFPARRTEVALCATIFCFYFAISMVVFSSSDVIERFSPGYWGYLGYDNAWYTNVYYSIDTTEGLFLSRHPFMKLLFVPMSIVGQLVFWLGGLRAKAFFYILLFNLVTTLSALGVFRWLRNVLELTLFRSILLTVMFTMFFSNLILCFTPESFPVSQLVLIGSILAAARFTAERRPVPFADYFVWTLLGGAVTTTNAVCTSLVFSLAPGTWSRTSRFVLGAAILFVVLYLIYFAIFGGIFLFLPEETTLSQWFCVNYIEYNRNVPHQGETGGLGQWCTLAVNCFWTNSLVGPKLYGGTDPTLDHLEGIEYRAPQVAQETSWTQMLPGLGLLALFAMGTLSVFKERRLIFVLAVFGFSLFLHLVLRFGWQELHIYADHWIFAVPMVIGGVYVLTGEKSRLSRGFDFLLITLSVSLAIANGTAFVEFVKISQNA